MPLVIQNKHPKRYRAPSFVKVCEQFELRYHVVDHVGDCVPLPGDGICSAPYHEQWPGLFSSHEKTMLTLRHPGVSTTHPILIAQDTPFQVMKDIPDTVFHIEIVYFANLYVCAHNPLKLIKMQLDALVATGLLSCVRRLHLVICGPEPLHNDTLALISSVHIPPHVGTDVVYMNESTHEYRGVCRVWERAQELGGQDDTLLLYIHSKGITRYKGGDTRDRCELRTFDVVVEPWRVVLNIFRAFPTINKVGATCSSKGWIWHNFFWTRASYAMYVEHPVLTENRYYYEEWIGHYVPEGQTQKDFRIYDCFCMLNSRSLYNIGTPVNPYTQPTLSGDILS